MKRLTILGIIACVGLLFAPATVMCEKPKPIEVTAPLPLPVLTEEGDTVAVTGDVNVTNTVPVTVTGDVTGTISGEVEVTNDSNNPIPVIQKSGPGSVIPVHNYWNLSSPECCTYAVPSGYLFRLTHFSANIVYLEDAWSFSEAFFVGVTGPETIAILAPTVNREKSYFNDTPTSLFTHNLNILVTGGKSIYFRPSTPQIQEERSGMVMSGELIPIE